jgi:hypothetical protein
MSNAAFATSDDIRSRLRVTVATIAREIEGLSRQSATKEANDDPTRSLTLAWRDLVHQLDLGSEPERRECPICHHVGMAKATVCGFCWTKLTPEP